MLAPLKIFRFLRKLNLKSKKYEPEIHILGFMDYFFRKRFWQTFLKNFTLFLYLSFSLFLYLQKIIRFRKIF